MLLLKTSVRMLFRDSDNFSSDVKHKFKFDEFKFETSLIIFFIRI